MTARSTLRQAARNAEPLDGSDAQALEGALAQAEKELGELRQRMYDLALTSNTWRNHCPCDCAHCRALTRELPQ